MSSPPLFSQPPLPASPLLAPPLAFRNHQGELIDIELIAATQAKNQFGQMLEQVQRVGAVAIMRSGNRKPKAVLLSYEEFLSLVKSRAEPLHQLTAEFDSLLARMQTPAARAGMQKAFAATPAQMGNAAAALVMPEATAATSKKAGYQLVAKVSKKAAGKVTAKVTRKATSKVAKKRMASRPAA